ncbi:peptidoglycan-binding domain-containing protein [Rhizocola hellebori]|nr:peptidoglycan-binding domain-containing protein [Rhizocola hellebori]
MSSHHYGLSYNGWPTAAIDLGGYDDIESNTKDQEDMGRAADWIFEYFSDLTVELIHTQPHNDHETYVRDQVRVPPYAAADHVNHIHWATSTELMDRIEERARSLWGDGSGPVKPGGGVDPQEFDLPPGHYYGLIDGPAESHGGYYAVERPVVRRIQERLQALGFAPNVAGWADGLFEEATESAVKSFQTAQGLPPDGRVNHETWDKLFDSETKKQPGPGPTGIMFGCDIYDFTVQNGLTENHVRSFVENGGLTFINAKFWEQDKDGATYPHKKAAKMLRVATEAGLPFPCGFVAPRTGVSPQVTVTNLIAFADSNFPMWREHPGFWWQVDVEHWADANGDVYDPVDINLGVAVAKHLMKEGQKPAFLYAAPWAYHDTVPNYQGRKLWASNYSGSGASRDYREMYLGDNAPGWKSYSGSVPTINQFCSDGKVNGWGPLVMSAFRGGQEDFRRALGEALAPYKKKRIERPTPEPVIRLNGGPRERTLVAASVYRH